MRRRRGRRAGGWGRRQRAQSPVAAAGRLPPHRRPRAPGGAPGRPGPAERNGAEPSRAGQSGVAPPRAPEPPAAPPPHPGSAPASVPGRGASRLPRPRPPPAASPRQRLAPARRQLLEVGGRDQSLSRGEHRVKAILPQVTATGGFEFVYW